MLVFSDLGFGSSEAEEMTAKCMLITARRTIIAQRKLTQREAARICGTDQPALSNVMHGRLDSVTIDRLANWLTALGRDNGIILRPVSGVCHGRLNVIGIA